MNEDCHPRLCAAVLLKTAPSRLIETRVRNWASVTFVGARHWLRLIVPTDAAEGLARDLPDAEFDLPGHLVADMAVVRQQPCPEGILLDLEALTVLTD